MDKNTFLSVIVLPLLLLQSLHTSAHRFNAYCTTDSDCDQYQKCHDRLCRCNQVERRFWTGEICAICIQGFTVTVDRCYKRVQELRTWSEARAYCRALYSDLFTWRNNVDEQFIRPTVHSWSDSSIFKTLLITNRFTSGTPPPMVWAAAVITSVDPYTVKWMDPDGMKLTSMSAEWCNPTVHSGYTLPKEPTSKTRPTSNGTEHEDCVTYNFGSSATNLLCLGDDYCTQKYPFICEMNGVSMKLANSVAYGSDGEGINFEQEAATPKPALVESGFVDLKPESGIGPGNPNDPAALAAAAANSSMKTIGVVVVIGILLIAGAIFGYMSIAKKKQSTSGDGNGADAESSQGRPSFTSSVQSMVD